VPPCQMLRRLQRRHMPRRGSNKVHGNENPGFGNRGLGKVPTLSIRKASAVGERWATASAQRTVHRLSLTRAEPVPTRSRSAARRTVLLRAVPGDRGSRAALSLALRSWPRRAMVRQLCRIRLADSGVSLTQARERLVEMREAARGERPELAVCVGSRRSGFRSFGARSLLSLLATTTMTLRRDAPWEP